MKHSTSVTDRSCCPVTGRCSLEARSARRRNVTDSSSPNPVSRSLCLVNDLCTKSHQKSRDQQRSVSDIRSDQMSVVMTSWRHTDRQGCLTLPGRLETQGEPRSYHIKHTIHAVMPPTCFAPLHPNTSSGGKSYC